MTHASSPSLIGLDWGTSSLRGYLMAADGDVIETAARPWGIQHLPAGGFPEAFQGLVAAWLRHDPPLPIVAAGMVGSRQGWREVPYVECPADAATIARGLLPFSVAGARIHLVPGVIQRGPLPNVLRGEETQIVGTVARDPTLASDSLLVLPGTHAKWARVRDGRLIGFETYITGELFAVLREHSLLGKPAREAGAADGDPAAAQAAFERGLAVARDSGPAGVAGRLFTARSLFLTGDLSAADTLHYLSGLLIGEEIRSVLASRHDGPRPPVALIGDATLCARYHRAWAAFGGGEAHVCGDSAAGGLWRIAAAAGLVSPDR